MTRSQKIHAIAGARVPSLRDVPFVPIIEDSGVIQLTDRQRQELVGIATRLRLPARTVLYEADSPAKWLFVVSEGLVKTFRDLPSGKRRITAFLQSRDIFGLFKNERYVNTAQTVTRVTLYRLPLDELRNVLRRDGDLQFAFLRKITHELREAQHRSVIVGRRDAAGRVAMFLTMIRKKAQAANHKPTSEIPLLMSRSDIADYLALSLEAVSRATAELQRRQLVEFEAHLARVLDEKRLAKLAATL